ncbi:EI24 domain-containing protein [Agromyces archimandritae]|uniref:EI24 domain-containing protein n=2 Tax=Agromyces archimandritae TaxID=2781962 RepID=A0A975FR44_9MICO|nr:EI24 domain-containing protein [Agromyces archimandritae]
MFLGLVPAAIVGALALAALIVLGMQLPGLVDLVTPFADGWHPFWAGAVRIALGIAGFTAAVLLVAVTFTAVTLAVGDPFYERIWMAVETEAGDPPAGGAGFWRGVADAAALIGLGLVAALAAAAAGAVPVIGAVLGPVAGVVLSGWVLGRELTSRGLAARDLGADARHRVRRGFGARQLGFGIAVQLCFMVPFGAVAVMPAAVAGAAMLTRRMLDAPRPASTGH